MLCLIWMFFLLFLTVGGIPSRERTKTVTTEHSTENVIFLFTSDSGNDQMTKLLLSYGSRSAIPQNLLLNEIKSALNYGKFISKVVPYFPLDPDNIEAILHAKVRNMAADGRHSHWADLVVDNDVLAYFSGPQLVKYTVYNTKAASSGSATGSSSSSSGGGTGEMLAAAWGGGLLGSRNARGTKVFATWGARSLENTGK